MMRAIDSQFFPPCSLISFEPTETVPVDSVIVVVLAVAKNQKGLFHIDRFPEERVDESAVVVDPCNDGVVSRDDLSANASAHGESKVQVGGSVERSIELFDERRVELKQRVEVGLAVPVDFVEESVIRPVLVNRNPVYAATSVRYLQVRRLSGVIDAKNGVAL